jgi:UDP-N-acetyl-D-galactosamine dehydrogenase
VFDIIDELNGYSCKVDVYDPWLKPSDIEPDNFDFIENPFKNSKKYDAIIVAVGHKVFKDLSREDYENISLDTPTLIDIKGIIENPTWRL